MNDRERKRTGNKPKTTDKNVSAEERFASIRPFKSEQINAKTNAETNIKSNAKPAKTQKPKAEDIKRFLEDDEEAIETKQKKPAVKGRVIGEINKTPNKKNSKKGKKGKKKKASPAVLLIAAIFAVLLVLSYFLMRIEYIEVEGNILKTDDEIKMLAGIETGSHIWLISKKRAENAIETDPYIQSADIVRIYPNSISINVVERPVAAVIEGISAYAVIDESGYVLSIDDAAKYDDILRVTGMGASGYKVATYLGDENDFMARTLLSILDAMNKSGIKDDIKSLDISNPMSIKMQMKSGIYVHMGQSDNAQEKLEKLSVVLPWLSESGYCDGTVDISVQGDPVYSPPSTPTPVPTETPIPTQTPDLTQEVTAQPQVGVTPEDSE